MTIRLAHLSDIHFGGENRPAADAAIEEVQAFAPHLTIITGDLTKNGKPPEFAAARAWLARLPRPLMVTPGNHDTPYLNLILRALTPFNRYRRYIGEPGEAFFDRPGLSARSINSARGAQPRLDWSKGALNLERIGRVANELGARTNTLKVFACHHPLIDLPGMPVTGGVRRGKDAAALLEQAGVNLILTGHVHIPFALALGTAPTPCYAIGAGTLSLRTRGAAAGFTLIQADDDLVKVTALAWNDRTFEPWQIWPLPRH